MVRLETFSSQIDLKIGLKYVSVSSTMLIFPHMYLVMAKENFSVRIFLIPVFLNLILFVLQIITQKLSGFCFSAFKLFSILTLLFE